MCNSHVHSQLMKGSLYTNFISERNFAGVFKLTSLKKTRAASRNVGKVSFRNKVGIQRAFHCLHKSQLRSPLLTRTFSWARQTSTAFPRIPHLLGSSHLPPGRGQVSAVGGQLVLQVQDVLPLLRELMMEAVFHLVPTHQLQVEETAGVSFIRTSLCTLGPADGHFNTFSSIGAFLTNTSLLWVFATVGALIMRIRTPQGRRVVKMRIVQRMEGATTDYKPSYSLPMCQFI